MIFFSCNARSVNEMHLNSNFYRYNNRHDNSEKLAVSKKRNGALNIKMVLKEDLSN